MDINGKVQSSREIYKDDNNTKKEYRKDGKLIKKVEDTEGSLVRMQRVGDRKDAPSKPIERTQYYGKKITTYSYDKAGNEIKQEYDGHNNLTKEYTKVFKSVSACRGGLAYHTPNHEFVFTYDNKNRVVKLESTTCSSYGKRVFSRKYRTDIHYEYDDELRF